MTFDKLCLATLIVVALAFASGIFTWRRRKP